jgi:predicted ATP-dependent Lon-type protease
MTGGTIVANPLGRMGGRTKCLVQIWDVVGFDEAADLQKMEGTGDVVEHVDPNFYGDTKTTALKALGLN